MNAVSVPSPSHFVKHLSPLWHTCTLPHQFAHCETLDNTVTQMHTSLHTTSKLHTLWNTRGHRRHSRRLETLKDTIAKKSALHRPHYMVWSENTVSLYHSKQKLEHRKHCILVSHSKHCILISMYPSEQKTENIVSRSNCTLSSSEAELYCIIEHHFTPLHCIALY